jgi:hypothetical protein
MHLSQLSKNSLRVDKGVKEKCLKIPDYLLSPVGILDSQMGRRKLAFAVRIKIDFFAGKVSSRFLRCRAKQILPGASFADAFTPRNVVSGH